MNQSIDFRQHLASMQDEMREQMVDYSKRGTFAQVPDGEYTFKVTAALKLTKAEPQRVMIEWRWIIAGSEYVGRQIFENSVLEGNKVGAQIARGHIEDLGYEWPVDNLAALEEIIDDIATRTPTVTAILKGKQRDDGRINYSIYITECDDLPGGTTLTTPENVPTPEDNDVLNAHGVLLDFCASHGVEGVDSTAPLEELVQALKESGMTWLKDQLTTDEIALLGNLGLNTLIETPPPPPPETIPEPSKKKMIINKSKPVLPPPTKFVKGQPAVTSARKGKK